MTTPPFGPLIDFDDDYDPFDPFDVSRRQVEETIRTADNVSRDLAEGSVRQVKDQIDTLGKAVGDQVDGDKQAIDDYTDGYQNAGHDLSHGDLAGAVAHVAEGNVKAMGHVLAGEAKAVGDVVQGGVKQIGDAIGTAGDVLSDEATGAKHLLGIGGDDKADTLRKVGHLAKGKLDAGREREQHARKELSSIAHKLAQNDPSAYSSADQLLTPGEAGLQFFAWFLDAYRAWTGSKITTPELRKRYEAETGMRFDALSRDAHDIAAQGTKLDAVDNRLQASYNGVLPHWQGTAAGQFESTMKVFFDADRKVIDDFAEISKGVTALTLALEKMIYSKANAVAGLYGETLAPGIDPVQARQTMVNVAKNEHCGDQQRRWVLATFHQEMHGRHGWDDDTDQWSTDALDDNSRRHAQEVAANWCNQVLVVQVERRLQLFDTTCEHTTQGIEQIFEQFRSQLAAVTNPYASMSASAPSDSTAPQSAGGGSGAGGGGTGGGSASGGGGASGGGAGGGHQQVPVPDVGRPYQPPAGGVGSTAPTGAIPGTTPGATPPGGVPGGLPSGAVPTDPADSPRTNPDGSVSFGPGHSLTLGRENRDGSIDLAQKSANGTQKYHVTFGPNGLPVVTTTDASGAIVTPDGVHANADGSVTLDGDLTVGKDADGNFSLTDTAGGTAHAYQVAYDAHGAPHVTDAAQSASVGDYGSANYGAGLAGADLSGSATAPAADVGAGPGGGSDAGASAGGSDASGGSSAGHFGGGTAPSAADHSAGQSAGQSAGHEGTGAQLGVGNQFGSQTGAESAGSPAATTAAAAATPGGQQSGGGHGMVGGMPMGAGMGRGAGGGGGDEIERRYAAKPENILDDGELEQWDRLGPTIG